MEKQKFDLFVHGNIYFHEYCTCGEMEDGSGLSSAIPYESIDLTQGIIIEGDMEVDNLDIVGKKVGISGRVIWKPNFTENGDKEEND